MNGMRFTLLSLLVCLLISCASSTPRSFSTTQSPGWASVELREDLEYEPAWETVLELLIKNFDIDVALREEGYIRTGWLYSWSGEYLSYYRVRVTLKFSADGTTLQFKPEAQLLKDENWRIGTDTRLVSTMKTDLMGTVGRTTR